MTPRPSGTRARATRIRRALIRFADIVDLVADDAPRIEANAHAWEGPLRAASLASGGGGGRAVDGEPAPAYGDPTGEAAGSLPATALLERQFRDHLATVERKAGELATALAQLDVTRRRCLVGLDPDAIAEVTEANRTDGLCPTCEHTTCTGRGDDRLRRITIDAGLVVLMCDPCRVAWPRRPVDDMGGQIPYSQFARGRRRAKAS